jgi:hypothetical protein
MLGVVEPDERGAEAPDDDEVAGKAGVAVRAGARVARVVLWASVAGVAVLFVVSAVVVMVLD